MNNCPNCKYPDVKHEGKIIHMKGIWTPGRPCAYCGEVLTGDVVKCISKSENNILANNDTYCGKETKQGYFRGISSLLNKENWEYPCPDCVNIIRMILNKVTS